MASGSRGNRAQISLLNANIDNPQGFANPPQAPEAKRYLHASKVDKTAKANPIYKNVLKFPTDFEHFKYFDGYTNPDRIDSALQPFVGAFNQDLNIPAVGRLKALEEVKKRLWPNLTDKERRMMSLPDECNHLAQCYETNPDLSTAYKHLRDAFLNFFTTPNDKAIRPDIQWLGFDFATGFDLAQEALRDLTSNLANEAAKTKLEEKLLAAGAFGDKKQDFYFWNVDPHDWSEISYQSRPVQQRISPSLVNSWPPELNPQYIALGNFTINAIPEGYVRPKGNSEYEICLSKVFLFINDVFNFEKDSNYDLLDFLGAWPLIDGTDHRLVWGTPRTNLFNVDFRDFKRHGYGMDFPVLSRLRQVKDFTPQCWSVNLDK